MLVKPHSAAYLAETATRVTASVIEAVGPQICQSLTAPQTRQALERCYQAALAAWLPEDDPLSQRYASALEQFWDEALVIGEWVKLVRGRNPDQDTLGDYCAAYITDSTLPPFPVAARLAASVAAFHGAVAQEPALTEIILGAARAATPQNVEASTRGIAAGRDMQAQNIITGTQINHIVQVYQASGGAWDEAAYRHALGRYLEWLAAAMGRVVLRGIQREGQQAVDLALDAIYVDLQAEALPAAEQELRHRLRRGKDPQEHELLATAATAEPITVRELLAQGPRVAVIGAPGCGKTTVLQHIAWTLAEALHTQQPALAVERLGVTEELPLPILLPLSSYAEHRRRFADALNSRQRQLTTFFTHYLQERHAELALPDDFFATLLTQGQHVILLLDGLDEVPNEDERALVTQAVRDLTYGRRHIRLVVSSRTQAYQGKAVLGGDFRVVRVLPLQPEAVATLIQQAYRAIYPAEAEHHERERQAHDLIDGVSRLEEERATRLGSGEEHRLVTTPLLVRMLLIVHFNLRRLPAQRAELYMAVVDTLLTSDHNPDVAVAQRLAQLGGDWRTRRDLLQYLAFYMHSRGQEAGREIGARVLTEASQDYLQQRRNTATATAAALVQELLDVSRQRGGLLEERAGQYRFGHLSFQEFLTARYLAEVEREVSRIATFLGQHNRLQDSWWREVVLLTGGYLHITAAETETALLRRLAQIETKRPARTAQALAAAELAATVFLEWGGADTIQTALANRLAGLLTTTTLRQATTSLACCCRASPGPSGRSPRGCRNTRRRAATGLVCGARRTVPAGDERHGGGI